MLKKFGVLILVLSTFFYLTAAFYPNTVTSSGSKPRFEYAYLTNTGSCAVSIQSGTWITSVSDPGTGQCQVNWASSTWSIAPICTVSGIGGINATFLNPISTTGANVFTQSSSGGGTSTDSGFYIHCIGPR